MNLKIILPSKILLEQKTNKIVAEGRDGSFCLLPRHIDFVSILVPSILTFENAGKEQFLIHDKGLLVKQNQNVTIAIKHGLLENSLGALKSKLEQSFQDIEKEELKTKKLLDEIEMDFMKRFIKTQKERT